MGDGHLKAKSCSNEEKLTPGETWELLELSDAQVIVICCCIPLTYVYSISTA